MTRIRVEDAEAEGGGVARIVISGHDRLLLRPEIKIFNLVTNQSIAANGWARDESTVTCAEQRIEDGSLVLELDGVAVNEVLEAYLPVRISVPALNLVEDLRWPEIVRDFAGNAMPRTRIAPTANGAQRDEAPPPQEAPEPLPEPVPQPEPTPAPVLPEQELPVQSPPSPPPTPPQACSIPMIALALIVAFALGAGGGYLAFPLRNPPQQSGATTGGVDEGRLAQLESDLAGMTAERDALAAAAAAAQGAVDALTADLAQTEALRKGLETLALDALPAGALDLPAMSPDGHGLDHYLDGKQPWSGSANDLYNAFVGRITPGEPYSEESLFLLRASAAFGNVKAMYVLGSLLVDGNSPDPDDLRAGIALLRLAAALARAQGMLETDQWQAAARAAFDTHGALLAQQP